MALVPTLPTRAQVAFEAFESIPSVNGFAVPDPEIAVGVDEIVAATNQELRVFTRNGVLLASGRLANEAGQPPGIFPTGLGDGVADPEVL